MICFLKGEGFGNGIGSEFRIGKGNADEDLPRIPDVSDESEGVDGDLSEFGVDRDDSFRAARVVERGEQDVDTLADKIVGRRAPDELPDGGEFMVGNEYEGGSVREVTVEDTDEYIDIMRYFDERDSDSSDIDRSAA